MLLGAKPSYWVHIVIYAYICCILPYMLALMLVVCYQNETIVNIDIIAYMRLLSDINCTKVAVISATAIWLICNCA